ncbi:uncharacterized protein, partial [Diadema setosum]|uniref:uncharacterized protein n=1 Tax=Diadema setosum TaxID=31175 RepID=UPI003B3BBF4C
MDVDVKKIAIALVCVFAFVSVVECRPVEDVSRSDTDVELQLGVDQEKDYGVMSFLTSLFSDAIAAETNCIFIEYCSCLFCTVDPLSTSVTAEQNVTGGNFTDMRLTPKQLRILFQEDDEVDESEEEISVDESEEEISVDESEEIRGKQKDGSSDSSEEQRRKRKRRKATTDLTTRWPQNTVMYEIDSTSADDESYILNALEHWMSLTCLKFVPYSTETGNSLGYHQKIRFFKGDGCWSYVGRIGDQGTQDISIGNGCNGLGTTAHEIGHAIGFFHEQQRPDRDDYIQVHFSNILNGDGIVSNFIKLTQDEVITTVPYDIGSLMHYGSTAFANNSDLPTITTLDPFEMANMGQRNGLSFKDVKLANLIYKCAENCSSDLTCENDGYLNERCECVCPEEYTGTTCQTESSDYTEPCAVTYNATSGVIESPNYGAGNYPDSTVCMYYIKPENIPEGAVIELTFEAFSLEPAETQGCLWDYVEVMAENPTYGGVQYCGSTLPSTIYSVGQEIMIWFRSDESINYPGFRATYTVLLPSTAPPTKTPTTQPPTEAPTTKAPTEPPTTKAPTDPPTTKAPTEPPTTKTPTEPPTTKAPTEPPTTKAPTEPPTTKAPTEPPTTKAPTEPPTTKAPTEPPTTKAPTEPPTTKSPTDPPTTKAPTEPPTTKAPTEPPTTKVPTEPPTTKAPTEPPTTKAPTDPPTTKAPTEPPTTKAPTEPPTTKAPTEPPTTKAPTEPPTTKAPTEPPTTKAPTEPPTTKAPTEPPTTKAPTEPPTTKAPTEPPTTKAPTETPTTKAPTEPPTTKPPTEPPT